MGNTEFYPGKFTCKFTLRINVDMCIIIHHAQEFTPVTYNRLGTHTFPG